VAGVPGVASLDEFDPRQLGPYVLLGRLGAGGMGSVYLGRRDDGDGTGPLVAIKVIRVDLAEDPAFRRRFELEGRTAQRVHHAYTAAVLDVDITGSRPYLVTEYIEGPTLAARVRDHGPLAASNLIWLAGAVAEALRAIHAAGVIHRDLKPANILLALFGSARVIDFGIARALDATTMATQGAIGTPAFMAPEQVLNQDVTAAADIHAWGAVLAFAATGRGPFDGDSIHLIAQRIIHEIPDLAALPETLRPLAARALAKSPADRPTAAELVDSLSRAPHPPAPRLAAATGLGDGDTTSRAASEDDRRPASTAAVDLSTTVEPAGTPASDTGLADRALGPPSVPLGEETPVAPDGPSSRTPVTQHADGDEVPPPPRPRRPRHRRSLATALAATVAVVVGAVVTTVALTRSPGHALTPGITSATVLGQPLTGPAATVASVAFSREGHLLAAGSGDGTVRLWDVSKPASPKVIGRPLTGPTGHVAAVAFSPDRHTLAAGSWDKTIWLWDVSNPRSPRAIGRPLTGPTGLVAAVAFSPDGHTLAAGSGDDTVWQWDVSNRTSPKVIGRPLTGPTGPTGLVAAVAFSPDGYTLAAGSYDDTVRLWNVSNPASPRMIGQTLPGPALHLAATVTPLTSVAFSPDGHTLAAGSNYHTVSLWDVSNPASPKPIDQPMTGPAGYVYTVAFSPDGHTLAAGSDDGTVWLWDVSNPASPKPIGQPLTGPTGSVYTVAFSPDGHTLAAGSADQTIRLWKLH
jgi:serine/threonine protein kinase